MILFILKESFKLISRAKFSFILSLISTTLSVLLIITSLLLITLSDQFESDLKKNVNINLFLTEPMNQQQVKELENKLKEKEYISSANYISKEKAAENFIKETGEDFRKILDYNPLPASFSIKINEAYLQVDTIKSIVSELRSINEVDEVVYQQEFVSKLLNEIEKFKNYIFIVTAALILISIYIVYSTLQLIIKSKYEELDTMKLVGAKISTIKMPIVLNGIYIGIIAGVGALGILSIIFYYLEIFVDIRSYFNLSKELYIGLVLFIGPLIASMISWFSLRKISLKI